MNLKQKLRKGWSLLETVIVLGVVAILGGTSVGLYFGLNQQDPETQSVTVQQQAVDLWESLLNNGTEYSAHVEDKAHEFCTGYLEKMGVNIKANYRLLEFDTYVSAIPNESEINRAYDPSGNSKEAVIIKLETTYPSYFISTASSVIKLSAPYETDKIFNQALLDDNYVSYSGVLNNYNIDDAEDDFSPFFELSDINYNGNVVRGVKYVRYNVLNGDGDVYATVFGRANRSLDEECEGEYLPKSFALNGTGGSIFHTSTFKLIEKRGEENYNYDPDHIYDHSDTYLENKETYTSIDKDGKEVTETAPISTSNNQYITGETTITFYPIIDTGADKDSTGGGDNGGNGGNNPDIDIFTPIPDEDLPGNNGDNGGNGGNGGATFEEDIQVDYYPITLAFAQEITPSTLGEKIKAWFKSWFGRYDFTFKYLFFSNLYALNEFINIPTYGDLLNGIDDLENRISYLHFANGFEIDSVITIPEDFVVFADYGVENTNAERKTNIDNFIQRYKANTDFYKLSKKTLDETSKSSLISHWAPSANRTVYITETGGLRFANNSLLIVESRSSGSAFKKGVSYGWEVFEYAEIVNEGIIELLGNSKAKITGLLSGSAGRLVAGSNASVAEPFKIVDYVGRQFSAIAYTERDIFPSDFYYLDSIRCNLELYYGAKYIGLLALSEKATNDDGVSGSWSSFVGDIGLVGPELGQYIFSMRADSKFIKSCTADGKSSFVVARGEVVYGFDTSIDTTYGTIGNTGNVQSAFDTFSTQMTGFKLSNIDLIINSNSKLIICGQEYRNNEKGYCELEVLPTSSIQVKKGGTLEMGRHSYIFLHDYFENKDVYGTSNGQSVVNGKSGQMLYEILNSTDNLSNIRYFLFNKTEILRLFYEQNIQFGKLLDVQGTLTMDTRETVVPDDNLELRDCDHGTCWRAKDEHMIITRAEIIEKHVQSTIFSWSLKSLPTGASYRINKRESFNRAVTKEHKCAGICYCKYDFTYNEYLVYYNWIAFGYAGKASTCWNYPTYEFHF